MSQPTPACLACGRTSAEVPLLSVLYQDQTAWICSQHLPILIHKPEQLNGLLPNADKLAPADHED